MPQLISKPALAAFRGFTMRGADPVEIYTPFATLGFRLTLERDAHIQRRIQDAHCSLCSASSLRTVHIEQYGAADGWVNECIEACNACGNWRGHLVAPFVREWLLPFIANFNPQSQIPALSALVHEIEKNPRHLFSTTPRQFELLVGSVLSAFMNCDVYHVGRSHDGGVDLIVVGSDQPMLVQVKRREDASAVEGVDVVKLLFASMFARGAKSGMVVTTAQRFSKHAAQWIHLPALKDNSFEIDLIGFDRLLHMTHCVARTEAPAWHNALRFWRTESADLRLTAGEQRWREVATVTADGTCYSLADYFLVRDAARYMSVDEEWLVLFRTPQQGVPIAFASNVRNRCWEVPVRERDPEALATHLRDLLKADLSSCRLIEGSAFHRVLTEAPAGFIEALLRRWAISEGDRMVTWEFGYGGGEAP